MRRIIFCGNKLVEILRYRIPLTRARAYCKRNSQPIVEQDCSQPSETGRIMRRLNISFVVLSLVYTGFVAVEGKTVCSEEDGEFCLCCKKVEHQKDLFDYKGESGCDGPVIQCGKEDEKETKALKEMESEIKKLKSHIDDLYTLVGELQQKTQCMSASSSPSSYSPAKVETRFSGCDFVVDGLGAQVDFDVSTFSVDASIFSVDAQSSARMTSGALFTVVATMVYLNYDGRTGGTGGQAARRFDQITGSTVGPPTGGGRISHGFILEGSNSVFIG